MVSYMLKAANSAQNYAGTMYASLAYAKCAQHTCIPYFNCGILTNPINGQSTAKLVTLVEQQLDR